MIILVVGMHRSGTSMVARGLHAMGLNLGERIDTSPDPANPHGHWEHADVWQAQERLLIHLGREWHSCPGPLPDKWLDWPDTQSIIEQFGQIAAEELAQHQHWLVKDPRTSLLIPLWKEVARRLEVPLKVLHVFRRADEVIASLAARQGMDALLARQIWLDHQRSILRDARGLPYARFSYDQIMVDPLQQFTQMGVFCGLTSAASRAMQAAVQVDGELWHQRFVVCQDQETDELADLVTSTDSSPEHTRTSYHGSVTVVMRTHWRVNLLPRAVRSVLAQTYPYWVLVIVNDGGAPALVEAEVAPYRHLLGDRLKLIHLERQVGMEACSNVGIAADEGEFVAIHDDDDSWKPEFLEHMLAHIAQTGKRAVVCKTLLIQEFWNGREYVPRERTMFGPALDTITANDLLHTNHFPPISLLFRRSLIQDIGWFEEGLPALGDWHFNRRIAAVESISVCPQPLAHWHRRDLLDKARNTPHSDHVRSYEFASAWPERTNLPDFYSQARVIELFGGCGVLEVFPTIQPPSVARTPLQAGLYIICMPAQSEIKGEVVFYYRHENSFTDRHSLAFSVEPNAQCFVLVNARRPVHEFALKSASHVFEILDDSKAGLRIYRLGDPVSSLAGFTASPRLPDVLCIGAQRSGTTWLHAALQSHPSVWNSPIKEFHQFDWDGVQPRIGEFRQRQALATIAAYRSASDAVDRDAIVRIALGHAFPADHGWSNYSAMFASASPVQLAMDFTPAYATLAEEEVAEIARVMPNLRVIYILRDPVERSISGALHHLEQEAQAAELSSQDLLSACELPSNSLRTDYGRTLDIWSRYFDDSQMLVMFFDDIAKDSIAFVNRVCEFLSIEPHPTPAAFVSGKINRNENSRQVAWPVLTSVRRLLALRWLPMIKTLEQQFPEPVCGWRFNAERLLSFDERRGWQHVSVQGVELGRSMQDSDESGDTYDMWRETVLSCHLPNLPAGGTIIELSPNHIDSARQQVVYAGLLICPNLSAQSLNSCRYSDARDIYPRIHWLKQISVLQIQVAELSAVVAEREQALQRQAKTLADQASQINELTGEVTEARQTMAVLLSSNSWLITRPLRVFRRLVARAISRRPK